MHSSTQMAHAGILFDADSEFKVRLLRVDIIWMVSDNVIEIGNAWVALSL